MSVSEGSGRGSGRKGPAYERAKALAQARNVEERRALAAQPDVVPEILYFLAEDDDTEVRRAVAANPNTPRHADHFLRHDNDEEVRGGLAVKIAALTPDLDGESREQIRRMTVEVLETLAQDEVVRVRKILAEAIMDIPSAPQAVVDRVVVTLARDEDLSVSAPVLENSPLLSEDVLVEIVGSPAVAGAIAAVSTRRNVSSRLSDAIISTDDDAGIVALLRNQTAQIREEALDQLIDKAPEKPGWHEPLVRRPRLTAKSAVKLAKFVAFALVQELQRRADVDDQTSALLSEEIGRRLENNPNLVDDLGAEGPIGERNKAVQMHNDGEMTDKTVTDALSEGRREFVLAALALRSGLQDPVVHSMMASRNVKAIAALAWKSGMNAAFALQLQLRLGDVAQEKAIKPTAEGEYSISEDEMSWQIDLVADSDPE